MKDEPDATKKKRGNLALALLFLGLGIATIWTAEAGYGPGVVITGRQAQAFGILWIVLASWMLYSYFRR